MRILAFQILIKVEDSFESLNCQHISFAPVASLSLNSIGLSNNKEGYIVLPMNGFFKQ